MYIPTSKYPHCIAVSLCRMAARKTSTHRLELALPVPNHTAGRDDQTRRPCCVRRGKFAVFAPVGQVLELGDMLSSAIFIEIVSALTHDGGEKRDDLYCLAYKTSQLRIHMRY